MCGVIGYWPLGQAYPTTPRHQAFASLLLESRVRGMHAYGLKQPLAAVYRSSDPKDIVDAFMPGMPAIAHARYSTSGDWRTPENNQPIEVGHLSLAFNGVIHMGTREEFSREFGVECETYNDGEVFLRLLEKYQRQHDAPMEGDDLLGRHLAIRDACVASVLRDIGGGSFAGCWLEGGVLHAVRNERRPLWSWHHLGAIWYASTLDIFLRAGFPKSGEGGLLEPYKVQGHGVIA